jgi:Ca-activated chloride channel family protein
VVAVVTDGYVSVEREAFDVVRASLGEANLFAFGIGSSVNRHLIEGLAHAGFGESFVVERPESAEAEAQRFSAYIAAPVLTDVNVRFDGLDVYDVEPRAIPDVFAARPIVVQGKYRGTAHGKIVVSGRGADGAFSATTDLGDAKVADDGSIARLWARTRLARLSDDASALASNRQRIVALGLTYHLLTEFTSFVAVDSAVRKAGSTTVKQPLPMPRGVDSSGVLAAMSSPQGGHIASIFGNGTGGGGAGGTIGLGHVGVIGHLSGAAGVGQGYGSGGGRAGTNVRIAPQIMVTGSLDRDVIRRVVRAQLPSLQRALQASLAQRRAPNVSGRVVLKLVIAPDGRVTSAEVEGSTLGDAVLDALVATTALGWRFPPPGRGGVVVHYPIELAL